MTNKKDEKRLEEYKDTSGLSLKDFRAGLWLARNRKRIYRLFVYLLIMLCLSLFGYSAYRAVEYFNSDTGAADNNDFSFPRQTPDEIQYGNVKALRTGEGYDLTAQVNNTNDKYIGYFSFCFVQGEKELACDESFVLPNEEKYIFSLGVNGYDGSGVSLSIKNLSWQRIDLHKVPDWDAFKKERLNLPVSGIDFKKDNAGFYQLEFSISNKSPYSYIQVPLSIILLKNGQVAGVNRYFIKPFNSGQDKSIHLTWLAPDSVAVDSVMIIPDLDIYDDASYIKQNEF